MFNIEMNKVVMIKKTKPIWMYGLLNGVGGKIEQNEEPLSAMIREFHEETGLFHLNWILSHIEEDKSYHMSIFYAITENIYAVETITEEVVDIYNVNSLPNNLCPNISFHIETIENNIINI
jgi:8-oxo-dGTP diphosphatase